MVEGMSCNEGSKRRGTKDDTIGGAGDAFCWQEGGERMLE